MKVEACLSVEKTIHSSDHKKLLAKRPIRCNGRINSVATKRVASYKVAMRAQV
jgi:hypothetical protein